MGAAVGPVWNEPRNRTARIIVESALGRAGRQQSRNLLERMLNPFATDMQVPAAPSLKTAQKVGGNGEASALPQSSPKPVPKPDTKQGGDYVKSGPKIDPRTLPDVAPTIDWRAKQHTDAIPWQSADETPREAEWLGEFLGVKKPRKPDLGKLTGLNIRLPLR